MDKLTVLIVVLTCIVGIDCARILCIFTVPPAKNITAFSPLTDELLQRGHDLVVITADPGYKKDNQSNITEIDVHDATYGMWKAELEDSLKKVFENPGNVNLPDIAEIVNRLFVRQFETAEFQKIIKEDNVFDLVLLDAGIYSNLIVTRLIKAPVVLISSFGSFLNHNSMGVPSQEFIYPTPLRRRLLDLTFLEQMFDVFNVKRFKQFYNNHKSKQNGWFKSVLGYDVSTEELQKDIDLVMLNNYPLWEGIRPKPLSVIHVGGLHTKSGEGLPQDLQHFLNSSKNGVIYVSFGTAVDTDLLPPEKVQIMVNVLSELPFVVLWKWDKGELPGKGKNILTSKWFPQADLLKHPKMKLFITHGGLQSTEEAIAAGVPLIGIPFFNDQFFNCQNYIRHKIGLQLDFATLSEDELRAAISRVITDKGYRENIFEIRTLMRDRPRSSINHAASWIEYILRHRGSKHLHTPSANIHWSTYLELELLLIVLFFVLTIFLACAIPCYCLFSGLFRSYSSYSHRRQMGGMYFPR